MVANKKPISHRTKGKHVAVEKRTPAKSHVAAQPSATATIDRRASRDRRAGAVVDRRVHSVPVVVERRALERRVKVTRRRQIDPTTCERDYSTDEIEFMGAMDEYKRSSGRMFPTCSEVLEVIKSLGYVKCPKTDASVLPDADVIVHFRLGRRHRKPPNSIGCRAEASIGVGDSDTGICGESPAECMKSSSRTGRGGSTNQNGLRKERGPIGDWPAG